jgi:SAM-dependent methyltransferase
MGYLKLASTHPELSFLISKNPESPMLVKSIRKGHGFGYFSENNSQEYNILFRDGIDEISFGENIDSEFEYLSKGKFASSAMIISLLNEYFSSVFKKPDLTRNQEQHSYTCTLGAIQNPNVERFASFFTKTISSLKIDIESISGSKFHKVHFIYENPFDTQALTSLLNIVFTFCLCNAAFHHEDIFIDDMIARKGLSMLISISAPYYLFYIYKTRILEKFGNFEKFKDLIMEIEQKFRISLYPGNNFAQRRNFILSRISKSEGILDIGCGEGNYMTMISKFEDSAQHYIGFDISEEAIEKCNQKIIRKSLSPKKYNFFSKFEELDEYMKTNEKSLQYQIICSEVVEHMEFEEVSPFIENLLSLSNVSKLIFTTPNRDFNEHYKMEDGEIRHEDHKFETTLQELYDSILKPLEKKYKDEWYITVGHVPGDSVQNNFSTVFFIFTKLKQ